VTRYYEHISAAKLYEMMRDEGAMVTGNIPAWGASGRYITCGLRFPDGEAVKVQYSAVRAAVRRGFIRKARGMHGRDIWILNDDMESIP
jgi:hypothetical protein